MDGEPTCVAVAGVAERVRHIRGDCDEPLQMSKQALNYLLGQLESLGYLERQPDPDDLRSKRVALTGRGEAAIRVIRDAVGELETTWAQQLGQRRFAQLRSLLLDVNQLT
jgi:DNA-binding MarR family transcriptional regulator